MKPIHKLALELPRIEGEDFAAFCDDIREQGLLEDIVLYQGMVIDGANRQRACEETGIPPRYRELGEGVDPVAFIISQNLVGRRHLSKGQIAMYLAKVLESGMAIPGNIVSERTLRRAKRILKTATQEIVEAVVQGKKPLAAADAEAMMLDAANIPTLPTNLYPPPPNFQPPPPSPHLPKNPPAVPHLPKKPPVVSDAYEGPDDAGVPDIVRDKEGAPVPASLVDIFASTTVQKTAQSLRDAGNGLKGMVNWNPWIADHAHFILDLSDVIATQAPYAVCPRCEGRRCELCRACGWVPKWRKEEMS